MNDTGFWGFLIPFLLMASILIPVNLEMWRNRVERYDLYMPKNRTHKPRMKYLTELSCEETLLQLTQMCAPFECTFKKEKEDQKDQMYVFSITEVPLQYYGMFRGSVTYKVLVTPTQKGSAVWLFLFSHTKTTYLTTTIYNMKTFTDNEMLNMFAWEVEKLFEKLLNAVRVE